MKILWFTNIPAIASEKLGVQVIGGGWLHALGNELKGNNQIKLAIAFYHDIPMEPFIEDGVSFYPIYNKLDIRKNRIKRRFNITDENENDINEFTKIIGDFKPDVVHIHGTEMAFIRVFEKANIPIVVSIQGNITVYLHFYHRGVNKDEVSKYILKKKGVRKSYFYRNYLLFIKKAKREQAYSSKFKYIIGRTLWDRHIFSILSPNATYFHNDEILRNEFYLAEWKRKNREIFKIYTTTTNLLYKGFETIVEASVLLNISSNLNFEWRIGGLSSNDSIVKLVRRKYGNDYPDKNVLLLGKLSGPSIVNEMVDSDVYIMPSHIENSPNNLCEAMIIGLPCIATHAGGTNSLLKDGEEGLIIQDGDPWSMAGAIIDLFKNPHKAEKFGNNAKIRAKERHNPQKISNELIEIYTTIKNKEN